MDLKGGAVNELEMPSKVIDRNFIFMPQTKNVVESDEEWSRCGKWILGFEEDDMELVDKAWKDLQFLLADGTLIWLKASTAALKHNGFYLHCYTGPSRDEIRRAASAIRQVVEFRGCLFYKPNKLTEMGISYRTGHKQISTYMHTYLRRFYKKDSINRWMLDDENYEKNFSHSSQFFRQHYSGPDLLSLKTHKEVSKMGDTSQGNPHWSLYFSCLEEQDFLPPEIDRVVAMGTTLLSEGRILGLQTCSNKSCGVALLFVAPDSDVCSQLELCDQIFQKASLRGLMYYWKKRQGDSVVILNVEHDYMYTSDGELYKTTKSGYKFVMSKPGSLSP